MPIEGEILGFPLGQLAQPPSPQSDPNGVDILFIRTKQVLASGDYTEVVGEENLRRALLRRLMTRPGTYRTKPGYGAGIQDFVKKSSNQATIEDLQNRVRGQVQQDRRVDKVLTCAVTKEFFSDQPGVRVVLVVQSKGRTLRPMTFDFKRTV
jgi:phage baseplate assembly protein W